nr:integrase, catalytic region, zinc finger, CCHC-type, peptidase aspartic, catalytic [Tanacetum cinerariifolium]
MALAEDNDAVNKEGAKTGEWNLPYKLKWIEKTVPVTKGIDNDVYSTVDACLNACEMWNAIERLKHGESINIQDLETNFYWEFRKFTSWDGESLESYYLRFYKMMNKLVINQCDVTNHKEYGHVARKCQKSKRAKDAAYHKENMLLFKQEEAGIQLSAEQSDWRDDTDDEPNDQELEAYYLEDHVQPESVNDTYLEEQGDTNITIEPLDMSTNGEMVDQDDDDDDEINDLNQTILEMKKELFAHQETISIMSQEKQAQNNLYKTREDIEIEKVIALENKVKVLDDIVYKIGQSVQTINMLNRCYNDNLALMLAPESDETIRISHESRSKLSDLIKPFDYEKINNIYDLFVSQREKSVEQRYFSDKNPIVEKDAVRLNDRCTTVLQSQPPPKENDPGSFTLPCLIECSWKSHEEELELLLASDPQSSLTKMKEQSCIVSSKKRESWTLNKALEQKDVINGVRYMKSIGHSIEISLSPQEAKWAIKSPKAMMSSMLAHLGLPPEVYALVSTHKVAKELWERIQMLMQGTSLTKQKRECKLYDEFDKFAYRNGESLHDFYLRFSLLLNDMNIYNMKLEKLQYASQAQSSTPLSITYPSNDFQSSVNHNAYNLSSSMPQVEYANCSSTV